MDTTEDDAVFVKFQHVSPAPWTSPRPLSHEQRLELKLDDIFDGVVDPDAPVKFQHAPVMTAEQLEKFHDDNPFFAPTHTSSPVVF